MKALGIGHNFRKQKMMADTNTTTVENLIENIFPILVTFRRELHREPELSWNEFKTTEKIIQFLRHFRYERFFRPLSTGVVTDAVSSPNLPCLVLRADIDALPIQDEKEVEYRSHIAGISHACGHDIHSTVVCGVAAVLSEVRQKLPVNVRFIFQPAEEPIPSGAPRMIDKGVLEGVQHALAMHVEPSLPLGTVSVTEGWVNAQSIKLEWEIHGSGGHSARPHLATDPLRAAVQLIHQANQFASHRWNHPEYPAVLTFTQCHSGHSYNAVPKHARLTATLRITNGNLREKYLEDIESLNKEIEGSSECHVRFTAVSGAPPVINHPEVVNKLRSHWKENRVESIRFEGNFRSMGGDDFGWFTSRLPSVLLRFGIATSANTPQLHTGLFDAPEEVIRIAVYFFAEQLLNWPQK